MREKERERERKREKGGGHRYKQKIYSPKHKDSTVQSTAQHSTAKQSKPEKL